MRASELCPRSARGLGQRGQRENREHSHLISSETSKSCCWRLQGPLEVSSANLGFIQGPHNRPVSWQSRYLDPVSPGFEDLPYLLLLRKEMQDKKKVRPAPEVLGILSMARNQAGHQPTSMAQDCWGRPCAVLLATRGGSTESRRQGLGLFFSRSAPGTVPPQPCFS